ncbi:hypothetical protein HT031_002757 [Scenedesmus sp. PABB004]|nr:hypothetical protein HT031_002757 [Scenedesmus sp. PABB004]
MRSRAAQYRESTARACVAAAAAPGCPAPARYLRRVAELVLPGGGAEGGGAPGAPLAGQAAAAAAPRVPGMSPDFARYLAAHTDPACDAALVKYFGRAPAMATLLVLSASDGAAAGRGSGGRATAIGGGRRSPALRARGGGLAAPGCGLCLGLWLVFGAASER